MESMAEDSGQCELCRYDPTRERHGLALVRHHIMRGPLRQKSTGKRFATLILCRKCHMERIHGNENWPEARQLALLKRVRPGDYDLSAYNAIKGYGPERIAEADIAKWEDIE